MYVDTIYISAYDIIIVVSWEIEWSSNVMKL